MKAEKEPEEFEFGCEDLTKDWFDEISDMEEPEEKIKCDENDFFDNEQDSVEPDSKPDKARRYLGLGQRRLLGLWGI